MTPEKKQARKDRNQQGKYLKAQIRRANLALVGKLVYERDVDVDTLTGIKIFDFPPAIRTARDGSILPLKSREGRSVPSLTFIGAKTYKQHGLSMKTRPGNKELHGEAIIELHSRSLAVEIDKALNPPDEGTSIPVIPMNTAPEVSQL